MTRKNSRFARITPFRFIVLVVVISLILTSLSYYYFISSRIMIPPERSEWAYDMIEADELNADGYYGEGVVVAIIDTGIDLDHPEFVDYKSGKRNLIWKDYVTGSSEPFDDNGHGTAMAGIIAGKTYGVAPKSDLIIVKTITSDGTGNVDNIAAAITFAVENDADVISMSLGGGRFPIIGTDAERKVQDAIDNHGIFVVAAAGNDGENDNGDVDSPSNVEYAISAGSVDSEGKVASFSSKGDNDGFLPIPWDDRKDPNKKPEVVAPGVDITVPLHNGNYGVTSGTSVSTAFVSGVIALTLDEHEGYQQENNNNRATVAEYKDDIMRSAVPPEGLPSHVHNDYSGYGIIKGERLSNRL